MRKSIDDLLAEARASLHRLDPVDAYEQMQNGTVVVDTRSDEQRTQTGAIPGTINIPLSVLEWRVDPASPHRDPAIGEVTEPIILICAEGYSSSLAAKRLQDIGFSAATDVVGGVSAWKDASLPVVAADG